MIINKPTLTQLLQSEQCAALGGRYNLHVLHHLRTIFLFIVLPVLL